jgi:hypothetical protein
MPLKAISISCNVLTPRFPRLRYSPFPVYPPPLPLFLPSLSPSLPSLPHLTSPLKVNWGEIEGLQNPNSWSEKDFGLNAQIAKSVQDNLETCALSLGTAHTPEHAHVYIQVCTQTCMHTYFFTYKPTHGCKYPHTDTCAPKHSYLYRQLCTHTTRAWTHTQRHTI